MLSRNGIAGLRVVLNAMIAGALVAAAMLAFGARLAAAEPANPALGLPPHVATETDTDACSLCHRGHTSASTGSWRTFSDPESFGNALLTGLGDSDVGLCFTCHGVDQLGSGSDVQTPFEGTSRHRLAPETSAYGASPKQCSSCHDTHGTARVETGTPYAVLLRSYNASGALEYQGDAYCATCHADRPTDVWDGLAVWNQTAHARELAAPTSGTLIICMSCHEPHGSPIAPLVRTLFTPPSAPATVTVAANDRTVCLVCHTAARATWGGPATNALSSHGSTTATVEIAAEWPGIAAYRRVGECQNCHAPMGSDDGSGRPVPKLAASAGRILCDRCHDADGPASTNVAELAYPPAAASAPELITAYGAASGLEAYGRLALSTRATTGTPPVALIGPREYRGTSAMGSAAAGDVNGDGASELVVADPSAARLDVFAYDPLRGLSDRVGIGSVTIAVVADFVGVGETLPDGSGWPEVIVANRSAGTAYVYRYDGSTLALVQGPISVGTVTGMAIGDVLGTATADVALTLEAPDGLAFLSDNAGVLDLSGPYPTLTGPRAPSIGDAAADAGNEIVVCNAGEPTLAVSVFGGSGDNLGNFSASSAGTSPTASAIGDLLPGVSPAGTSGNEVLVTYADPTGSSWVDVYPQDSVNVLAAPTGYSIGTRYNPASIAVGDVDGDGRVEAAIANAGAFTRDTDRREASTQIWRADTAGTGVLAPETRWAGGAELAGGRATVLVADVGGVGPTRHPVGGTPFGTHVSTETATVARHVECVDCHNAHEANASTAAAPNANGRILGSWGVSVSNVSAGTYELAEQRGIRYEYELCLKCHSPWTELDGDPDIAAQVNTENPSVHAVEATATTSEATPGSFVSPWSNSSVLYCTDCHGNSVSAEPVGPHRSERAPILARPYLGILPAGSGGLCYACHAYDVYYTGTLDGSPSSTSQFYDVDLLWPRAAGHSYHVNQLALGCASCHVAHGSVTEPHLLRSDIGFTHAPADGGACANACHTGGASHAYARP